MPRARPGFREADGVEGVAAVQARERGLDDLLRQAEEEEEEEESERMGRDYLPAGLRIPRRPAGPSSSE